MTDDLFHRSCAPCRRGEAPLDPARVQALLARVPGWALTDDGRGIERVWTFRGYAPGVALANHAAALAGEQGHHPEVGFGWGWCRVRWTTHAAGGLTENDFICAARLDRAVGEDGQNGARAGGSPPNRSGPM